MATISDILQLTYLATGESASGGFANWGESANDNWESLDDALGEVTSKTLSSSNVTLTATEERSLLIKLSGTLGANVEVRTSGRKGFWFVSNATSGAFSVTFKPTSGSGVAIQQGTTAIVACDGTNILPISDVTKTGTETLTNKTLTSPTINGGTLNSPAISNPVFSTSVVSGFLTGLTLSNNGSDAVNDIDIAVGAARDSADTMTMMLSGALTKRLDAPWAVGTNQGMRATGVAIADTTYHIFLIRRPDTGVVDIAADTSAIGANIAANTNVSYTQKRRIGSIVRAGATILAFTQVGDEFIYAVSVADISASNPGTFANTRILSVPLGIKVLAHIRPMLQVNAAAATTSVLLLTPFDQSDAVPTSTNATLITTKQSANNFTSCALRIMTATDGSIRSRLSASDGSTGFTISTDGWTDTRGRT